MICPTCKAGAILIGRAENQVYRGQTTFSWWTLFHYACENNHTFLQSSNPDMLPPLPIQMPPETIDGIRRCYERAQRAL